jgi:hypothetical protein
LASVLPDFEKLNQGRAADGREVVPEVGEGQIVDAPTVNGGIAPR